MLTYFNGAKGSKLWNTTFYVSFCFQVVKGRFTAKVLGFFLIPFLSRYKE